MLSAHRTPFGLATQPKRGLKTAERVARHIVADVVGRGLPPNASLPAEAEMLRQYGISRGSLREALRILEVYGLITIKAGPNGGPRVGRIDASDFGKTATFFFHVTGATFRELAQARIVIEPSIARLAAERREPEQLKLLRALVAPGEAGSDSSQADRVGASRELHSVLAQMADNRVLELIVRSFGEIFTAYSAATLTPRERNAIARVHQKIGQAVIDGDGDQAEELMRKHMIESGKDFARRHPSLVQQAVQWAES